MIQYLLHAGSPPPQNLICEGKSHRKGHAVSLTLTIRSTPDNSNAQGKSKNVRVIGSSSYRELKENTRE